MHAVLPGPVSDIFQCIPINFKTCSFLQWLRTAEEDDPEAEASPAEIAEDQQKVGRAPVTAIELHIRRNVSPFRNLSSSALEGSKGREGVGHCFHSFQLPMLMSQAHYGSFLVLLPELSSNQDLVLFIV